MGILLDLSATMNHACIHQLLESSSHRESRLQVSHVCQWRADIILQLLFQWRLSAVLCLFSFICALMNLLTLSHLPQLQQLISVLDVLSLNLELYHHGSGKRMLSM